MKASIVVFDTSSGLPLRTWSGPEDSVNLQAQDGEVSFYRNSSMEDLSKWMLIDGVPKLVESRPD